MYESTEINELKEIDIWDQVERSETKEANQARILEVFFKITKLDVIR